MFMAHRTNLGGETCSSASLQTDVFFCCLRLVSHSFFFPDEASYLSQKAEYELKELWQPIDRDTAQLH